jgi:hypothetical protein
MVDGSTPPLTPKVTFVIDATKTQEDVFWSTGVPRTGSQFVLGPNNAYNGSGGFGVWHQQCSFDGIVPFGGRERLLKAVALAPLFGGREDASEWRGCSRRWWVLNKATNTDAAVVMAKAQRRQWSCTWSAHLTRANSTDAVVATNATPAEVVPTTHRYSSHRQHRPSNLARQA